MFFYAVYYMHGILALLTGSMNVWFLAFDTVLPMRTHARTYTRERQVT